MADETPNIGKILGRIKDEKPIPEMPKGSPEDWAPKRPWEHSGEEVEVAQDIKGAMRSAPHWKDMPAGEREALELIATEISRICAGRNHWKDIALWVTLGEECRDNA